MKTLKILIVSLTTLFLISTFASAETISTSGHGYGSETSSTTTTLADGSMLFE